MTLNTHTYKIFKTKNWKTTLTQALYTVVTVLRVLGLKEKQAKVSGVDLETWLDLTMPIFSQVSVSMESHLALWKKREEFSKYINIVTYVRWAEKKIYVRWDEMRLSPMSGWQQLGNC